jgi:hypothetical protein
VTNFLTSISGVSSTVSDIQSSNTVPIDVSPSPTCGIIGDFTLNVRIPMQLIESSLIYLVR